MTDDLERRLRAARPSTASTDANAFDAELLARVREQPIARRRTIPRAVAVPAAAGVTLSATAVVMLGGGPGDVGGPSSASAITQILRWLNPPPGTILHVRSVETMGGHTTTRELWQSADDPESERQRIEGARSFESSGDAFYDPATDTIYDPRAKPTTGKPGDDGQRLLGRDDDREEGHDPDCAQAAGDRPGRPAAGEEAAHRPAEEHGERGAGQHEGGDEHEGRHSVVRVRRSRPSPPSATSGSPSSCRRATAGRRTGSRAGRPPPAARCSSKCLECSASPTPVERRNPRPPPPPRRPALRA